MRKGKIMKNPRQKLVIMECMPANIRLVFLNIISLQLRFIHEVTQDGELSRADDSKIASTRMHIGARLSIREIVDAAIEYTKSRTTSEHTDPQMATAGFKGVATAGNSGAAIAGDCGKAISRGQSASGENGLSVARGIGCRVKGGLGTILMIAEEEECDYDIVAWKAVVVDGETIMPNTWYELKSGELVECETGQLED